jgi:hypothetical protein
MPRGSHFLLLRQKQVTKEKATPEIVLILRCSEKSGTKKTRYARTVFRSDRFFLPLLGANQRGPVEPIFDRFAMGVTKAKTREVELLDARLLYGRRHAINGICNAIQWVTSQNCKL